MRRKQGTEHWNLTHDRRTFLSQAAHGFGAVALSSLLARESTAASILASEGPVASGNPLAPRSPHFPAKAKSVIFLFMVGGPSQMETFDPKPVLDQMDGQQMPASFGALKSQFVKTGTPLMRSAWGFRKYGQAGIDISDLYPHLSTCADDLAVIRSCYTESCG